MKIIAAYDRNGQTLTPEQIQSDMSQLLKEHEKACRDEPTWEFFGGMIFVNDHEYQLA